jgi:tripartite-type tricarboxylate transporter receptor subunit TctC
MSDFVPGYEAGSWFGIVAPKGTPADIVQTLNSAVNAGLADTTIKTRIVELGGIIMPGSQDDFATFVETETEKYGRIIRAANIRVK